MYFFTFCSLIIFTVLFVRTLSKSPIAPSKRVTVITGNQRKVDDASAVFGVSLALVKDDVDEIQDDPQTVAIQKVTDLYKTVGTCLCEDTSLGPSSHPFIAKGKKHVFPALIKHLIDACKLGNGNLVDALNAITRPICSLDGLAKCVYYYTSTVAFCDGTIVILFQCIMAGEIRDGKGNGDIDPYFVPFHYTLMRIENGQSVTLAENVDVNNSDRKTIGESPENRYHMHPRRFALEAAKTFLDEKGYTVIGAERVSP
jgi:hypothetical protein